MNCPLCGCSKYFTLNSYLIKELKDKWITTFKIDPFENITDIANFDKLQCVNCQMIYYYPVICADNTLYEYLSSTFDWYYERDKWEFDVALKVILEYHPESLLEFGCGEGMFLEKILGSVECSGIDINLEAIKICEKKAINIERKPFESIDKKFDMIVSFEVFEHLANIGDMISNLTRLLNKNGLLLVAVPNPNSFLLQLDNVLLDMPPHHNLGFNNKTFDYIADKFNLKLTQYLKEPLRYVHYQWYMNETFYNNSLKIPKVNGILKNIKRLLKKRKLNNIKMFRSLLEPHYYLNDREYLDGQTHLAIFQKL